MNFIIRPCVIEDAQDIFKLNNEEMGYSCSLEDTVKNLKSVLSNTDARVFVAECDGEDIGYIHSADYQLLYAPPMKNILGIAVSSDYRNKGVGRALLAAVEAWAKESGCASVRLSSGAERESAHAFYKNCGYEFVKQQYNFRKMI